MRANGLDQNLEFGLFKFVNALIFFLSTLSLFCLQPPTSLQQTCTPLDEDDEWNKSSGKMEILDEEEEEDVVGKKSYDDEEDEAIDDLDGL